MCNCNCKPTSAAPLRGRAARLKFVEIKTVKRLKEEGKLPISESIVKKMAEEELKRIDLQKEVDKAEEEAYNEKWYRENWFFRWFY